MLDFTPAQARARGFSSGLFRQDFHRAEHLRRVFRFVSLPVRGAPCGLSDGTLNSLPIRSIKKSVPPKGFPPIFRVARVALRSGLKGNVFALPSGRDWRSPKT